MIRLILSFVIRTLIAFWFLCFKHACARAKERERVLLWVSLFLCFIIGKIRRRFCQFRRPKRCFGGSWKQFSRIFNTFLNPHGTGKLYHSKLSRLRLKIPLKNWNRIVVKCSSFCCCCRRLCWFVNECKRARTLFHFSFNFHSQSWCV